ncbi:MAG: hypothetical protein EOP49_44845 [Sphingobacteriales bacterium]|nr:MAG: hypothetical protein EOP49_44845 [Sphingobacteriales bacterium]
MKDLIYQAFTTINIRLLEKEDKEELLQAFSHTKSLKLRDHIAAMFAGLNYTDAIPYMIEKIESAECHNHNLALVNALSKMDTVPYFIDMVRIMCTQDTEVRLAAFDIACRNIRFVEDDLKNEAINMLRTIAECKKKRGVVDLDARLELMSRLEECLSDHLKVA